MKHSEYHIHQEGSSFLGSYQDYLGEFVYGGIDGRRDHICCSYWCRRSWDG